MMSATPAKRRSMISEENVTAVYTECINLSAANKINTKNAFGLRLIDYMSYLIKHKPGEEINFKLVSCALDAGAKIYGAKVDCVQAEAQKVASGLVIALDKDKSKSTGEDDDGDSDHEELNEDGESRPKRRKVARKTVKTIATNVETLNNAKVECNIPPDPLFSLLSSSFDVGNVNGLLMSNLTSNEDGLLLLNPSTISSTTKEVDDVKLDRSLLDGILSARPQIVPQLSKFEFLARSEELDSSMSTLRAGTQSQDKISFAMDDANSLSQPFEASLEPPGADGLNPDPDDLFYDAPVRSDDEDDSHDKTVIENPASQTLVNQFCTVDSDGFERLVKVLSDQPSEYTYFNKELIGVWAGPEYWKLNPTARRTKTTTIQDPAKSARKSKKQFTEIDFSQPAPAEQSTGLAPKLKLTTLSNWSEKKLPTDVAYDPLRLLKPFLKNDTTFSIIKKTGIESDRLHPYDDNDSDGRSSPGIDAGMDNHFDDEFAPTQECFPTQAFNPDLDSGTYAPFSGDNLVDEPFAVSSTALPFSTHAKKIDVKRLKREMWTIVTTETLNKSIQPNLNSSNGGDQLTPNEEETTKTPDIDDQPAPVSDDTSNINLPEDSPDANNSILDENNLTFSEMYKKLPSRVGATMANNLSVPIAFVALLHLTNEKNLMLQGKPDLSDFLIKPEIVE